MKKQEMKSKTKRILIVFILLILLTGFCYVQNGYLVVTHYTYVSEKISGDLAGYRIVQISDLHNATFGKDNQCLVKKIEVLNPDMIVITGDMVDSNRPNVDVALDFATQAAKICPTYYITGNHENWLSAGDNQRLLKGLSDAGVICLSDETTDIKVKNSTFTLIGLNDESLRGNTLQNLVKNQDEVKLQILLAHEPQYLEKYAMSKVDLVLAGHAHGGQFRIPFVGGLVAPDQGFFPEYTEGVHVDGQTTMVISRGLGNSVVPLRLFNLPEVVCIDMNGGEKHE